MAFDERTGLWTGYIYCIQNEVNGKKYIGQTTRTPEARWSEHVENANNNATSAIAKAIAKYGLENFEFSVVKELIRDTREELISQLDQWEIYFIGRHDSYGTAGYNETIGGSKGTIGGGKGHKICVDAYQVGGQFYKTFDSLTDASTDTRVSITDITKVCQGKAPSSNGFVFRYCGDLYSKFDDEPKRGPRKYVYQFDLLGRIVHRFSSIADASRSTGCSQNCISEALDSDNKRSGRYLWKTKPICNEFDQWPKAINMYSIEYIYEKTYASGSETERDGFCAKNVSACCYHTRGSYNDHRFYFVDDTTQPNASYIMHYKDAYIMFHQDEFLEAKRYIYTTDTIVLSDLYQAGFQEVTSNIYAGGLFCNCGEFKDRADSPDLVNFSNILVI